MSKVFCLGTGRVCENEIQELKSIPGVPTSHPFVERVIGTIRRECLDRTLFLNSLDLQRKLDRFKEYYNEIRGHSSLDFYAPTENGLNFEKKSY